MMEQLILELTETLPSTTTTGNLIANSIQTIDIDAGSLMTIDTGTSLDINVGSTLNIDAINAINIATNDNDGAINIGTDGNRAITIGAQGVDNTASIMMKALGNITIDSDAIISLDSIGNSNFTTDSGNLTLSTTTTGTS